MNDFDEIEPGGIKFEFIPHEKYGCTVHMGSGSVSYPFITNRIIRTIPVLVNNKGVVMEFPSEFNSPNLFPHAVYIVTDREGLVGRICPSCKSYFRTDCLDKNLSCPYCVRRFPNGAFTTENQRTFMRLYINAAQDALNKRIKVTFDLGEAMKALPNNRPTWVYTEENQQHTFHCEKCKAIFNILGEFGACPKCGMHNYATVFDSRIKLLERQFVEKESEIKETAQRAEEWKNLLVRCVSEFESLANHIRKHLLRFPLTEKRKKDFEHLSFQNVIRSHVCLKGWYGIAILDGFSVVDRTFISRMFHRRHIIVHKGAQVDAEYLEKTRDSSVRLHQTLRIDSKDVRRLITLTGTIGRNLIQGFFSLR